MGFVLKFLGGPLGMYALIGVGVLVLGSLGYARIEHSEAARYKVERDAAKHDVEGLKVAVASKDDVIAKLGVALDKWKKAAEISASENEKAGQRADDYKDQLTQARATNDALAEKDNGLESCDQLLSIDLATACPGHALRVRKSASSRL